MNNTELKDRLNDEIQKRMTSNSWSFEIASRVINAKKKTKKRIAYFSYLSSFSLAAFAVIFYFLGASNKKQENLYQKFITKQVEGTYHYIKNNKSLKSFSLNDSLPDNSLIKPSENEIDFMIDEILSKR